MPEVPLADLVAQLNELTSQMPTGANVDATMTNADHDARDLSDSRRSDELLSELVKKIERIETAQIQRNLELQRREAIALDQYGILLKQFGEFSDLFEQKLQSVIVPRLVEINRHISSSDTIEKKNRKSGREWIVSLALAVFLMCTGIVLFVSVQHLM